MRRTAYVLAVGIQGPDVARYERRGVKVVNLPGKRDKYSQILAEFFDKLRAYWHSQLIQASTITEESLGELSLPEGATTRLCFFAIPTAFRSFYESIVFPIAESCGLVPLTADSVISPGDNVLAKVSALLDRAQIVVAEASSSWVLAEVGMAISRKPTPPKVLLIITEGSELPATLKNVNVILRPRDLSNNNKNRLFLDNLENQFKKFAEDLLPQFSEEPQRLLTKREYRAAVISAFTLLESTLSEPLPWVEIKGRPRSIYSLLEFAADQQLITSEESNNLKEWITVRNRLVHTQTSIRAIDARKIVNEILSAHIKLMLHE